ncbi:MAG: hypothetical protein GY835_08285 [bacterium]|nr:hypothetical protein [bacterium]
MVASDAPTRVVLRMALVLFFTLFMFMPGSQVQASGRVETLSRFLEYDQTQNILVYEITLRNLEQLPVSDIELTALPACEEGILEVNELRKEQRVSRRFTFKIEPGKSLFQPRFRLEYTKQDGERVYIEPSKSHIAVSIDFSHVDVAKGLVALKLSITNPNEESLIFIELKTENPKIEEGTMTLGDLKPGCSIHKEILFRTTPGDAFFNPTLYLNYHAFQTSGTKFHRNFYTVLQSDLNRVEAALKERNASSVN